MPVLNMMLPPAANQLKNTGNGEKFNVALSAAKRVISLLI